MNAINKDMKHLLAVYGTLKKDHGNSCLLEDSKFLGEETIPGLRMHSLGGYPAINKTEDDSKILVEVYEINNPDILKRIYRLEGYTGRRDDTGNWYDTTEVKTNWGNAEIFYFKKDLTGQGPVVPDGIWK